MISYEFLTWNLNLTFRDRVWYVLLFDSNFYPGRGCTYAVPGFIEFTGYTQATRPEYDADDASNYIISNATNKAYFTISTATILYGAGIVGRGSAPSTKGDTAGGGILAAAARFNASRTVVINQIIAIEYPIGIAAPAPAFEEC